MRDACLTWDGTISPGDNSCQSGSQSVGVNGGVRSGAYISDIGVVRMPGILQYGLTIDSRSFIDLDSMVGRCSEHSLSCQIMVYHRNSIMVRCFKFLDSGHPASPSNKRSVLVEKRATHFHSFVATNAHCAGCLHKIQFPGLSSRIS